MKEKILFHINHIMGFPFLSLIPNTSLSVSPLIATHLKAIVQPDNLGRNNMQILEKMLVVKGSQRTGLLSHAHLYHFCIGLHFGSF